MSHSAFASVYALTDYAHVPFDHGGYLAAVQAQSHHLHRRPCSCQTWSVYPPYSLPRWPPSYFVDRCKLHHVFNGPVAFHGL